MKTISLEKMNFESTDILSRLQMKKVTGGVDFCECSCTGGGPTWHYTASGQPQVPAQPSSSAIAADLALECGSSGGSCTGCTNGPQEPQP